MRHAPLHYAFRCLCAGILLAASVSLGPNVAAQDVEDTGEAATTEPAPSHFVVALGAGVGVGHRDVRAPSRAGDRILDSGIFPALGIVLEGGGAVGARGLLGIRLHYETSVGLKATQEPASGTGQETSLRSHHVEAGLTPGLRFSDAPDAVSLRVFAGWGFRGLRAVDEIALPQYMLSGPVLRPELRIPFSDGVAELRIAPEVQMVTGISSALRTVTTAASAGFAWGGEVALSVRLAQALRLHIDYRESHVSVGSSWGAAFADIERFATAGVDLWY
jgi:hypothetical protein